MKRKCRKPAYKKAQAVQAGADMGIYTWDILALAYLAEGGFIAALLMSAVYYHDLSLDMKWHEALRAIMFTVVFWPLVVGWFGYKIITA